MNISPSLLRRGLVAWMKMVSFTPLSNHFTHAKISVLSIATPWSGLSMCLEMPELALLGLP